MENGCIDLSYRLPCAPSSCLVLSVAMDVLACFVVGSVETIAPCERSIELITPIRSSRPSDCRARSCRFVDDRSVGGGRRQAGR
jgi:hypothetical protein